MRIISVVRQVLDPRARIRAAADRVSLDGMTYILDEMDAYGVEQALRLREAGPGSEVVALGIGPPRDEGAIRTALAMGADRGLHLETPERLDVISQARLLAGVIRDEAADLVFVGGRESDWDSSALGPAIAEFLGWPQSDWTTRCEVSGAVIRVVHDSDGGPERLELPLPAVITTQQGLDEPRRPTLHGLMAAARRKPRRIPLDDGRTREAAATILREEVHVVDRLGRLIEGDPGKAAWELAELLRADARITR